MMRRQLQGRLKGLTKYFIFTMPAQRVLGSMLHRCNRMALRRPLEPPALQACPQAECTAVKGRLFHLIAAMANHNTLLKTARSSTMGFLHLRIPLVHHFGLSLDVPAL